MNPGIDPSTFDPTVRPADDLFRHVHGTWLKSAQIRPDRATAGAFVELADEAELAVRTIVENAHDAPSDDDRAKISDLYASFMNEDRVESLGASPLADDLAAVAAVDDVDGLVALLGRGDRAGWSGLFGLYIAPDEGQPDRYTAYMVQSGLGLPDESYYKGEEFAPIREKYVEYLTRIFTLAGIDDAAARAAGVLTLESDIAEHHWDRVSSRDAQKTYNPMGAAELQSLIPAFDLSTWRQAADYPATLTARVIVSQPTFLEGMNGLITAGRLDDWRSWLYRLVVQSAAPYLSSGFVEANFDFYGRTLSGTDALRARWKRGVAFVESAMGEAVGRLYVAEHYPPAAKDRMDVLIGHLIEAYRESISQLAWMSDETKERALLKLDSFTPKVGHPVKWREYGSLVTDPGDLFGNVKRAHAVALEYELAKLGAPIDRDEWYVTPQTVNAYYNPTMNEIVFPAAILQPPFFHPEVDDAVNYGAIGAVIGHEIGHGFDDQGSHYDGTGALSNWWTEDDREAFEQLTSALIAQYDELSPEGADGKRVNGALTIGENIGDLGGLGIAYKAYRRALAGTEPEPIDGLTGDQRFFLSWAQAWQAKVRPEEAVRRLTVDPHSPPEFRCNQVVRNIDAFYKAFEVGPGDELWLDETDRVSIW